MKEKIGWGFIGAGGITNRFIKGLVQVPDAYLAAVASRTEEKAKAFAETHGGKAYTSYEEVITDKNVDVVYVATPHSLHMEHTLLALDLGKPVLCEKPMAPNAEQVRKMVSKSRDKGIYLMEAMWTRFFPAIKKVREWLDEGEIGKVHHVTADFGFAAKENPASRLFNPELAGGSLLDVGVYTVSFASMVFGKKPNRITSVADMASTGVDACMGCTLGYEGGGIASLFSAINVRTPQEARIVGEKGYIVIPKFWSPSKAYLYKDGLLVEEFCDNKLVGGGFQYEIAAVQDDLRAGRLENELMPLDETIAIAETMDVIRAQWGLVYPFEK
ncbi:MAG: Gfo/Idh/MocA family oxidoreductase [Clostridiaceae bacterium]|nr:Gfo/Idh/MocA family oxidoreductase [Clostridiaceae bacterium]